MIQIHNDLVVIKGAGDLASGVAFRLHQAGFSVVCTELPHPTVVRRTVSFAEAVRSSRVVVEGVEGKLARDADDAVAIAKSGSVAVLTDPDAEIVRLLKPPVVIDAILAKKNLGTKITDAPVVIGLGPGFTAGVDCHAVIETNRGHDLGRVIRSGQAEPNTGVPGSINGYSAERLLRSPKKGDIVHVREIGAVVKKGEVVATVDDREIRADVDGVLRGLIEAGTPVEEGMKVGDVDPRARPEHCLTISDKSLAIGGGALEATMFLLRPRRDSGSLDSRPSGNV